MSNEEEHNSQDQEMNIMEHLSELRNRLIWTAIIFILFFVLGFVFVGDIYHFFVKDLTFELTVLGPGDIVWIYLMLASVVAIIGTIPFLCIQIWLYIKPALSKKEQKVTLSHIPAIFFLFIGGLSFGYLVIQPLIFDFVLSLSRDMFETMFTVDKYFRFLLQITFPFAVLFEIPIIFMFLTSLGIIEPKMLRNTRKYAYLVLIVIGTMISPPDFFLQIIVAVPLIILYEISIYLSEFVYRKKLKREKQAAEAE